MRCLALVLPLVFAQTDYYHVPEYIKTNLDHSVKPCDDFYRHVCPMHLEGDQFPRKGLKKQLLQAIVPYTPNNFTNVIVAYLDGFNSVRNATSDSELRRILLTKCLTDPKAFRIYDSLLPDVKSPSKNCSSSTDLLMLELQSSATMKNVQADLKKKLNKLQNYIAFAAWYNYIRDERNDFAKKREIANEWFATIRETMLELLLDSTWVKKHNLAANITSIMDRMRFYQWNDTNKFEPIFDDFEKIYTECSHKWITGFFHVEYDLCLWKAVKSILPDFFDVMDDQERSVKIIQHNALHIWRRNDVLMYPSLYLFLDAPDEVQVLTEFGTMLAHEVGHAIFGNRKEFSKSEAPLDIECLKRQMKKTCDLFSKDWKCYSGQNTIKEDAADIAARETTLALAKRMLPSTNSTNLPNDVSLAQMYFYGWGIAKCTEERGNLDWHKHSSGVVRVNGVLRQTDDFRRAFGCKADDAMVMKEDERCHLFGKFAMH